MGQTGDRISVLVVEDDDALRHELERMLSAAPDITLLGAVGGIGEARTALAASGAPDVLVIDLGLPDGDGTVLIGELALGMPATSSLVLTVFGDEGHVVRALEA